MAKAKPKKSAAKKPAAKKPAAKPKASGLPPVGPVFRGLRTVIYQVDDLTRGKAFYSAATGRTPYFDELFYDVGGFELGLDPDLTKRGPGGGGAIAYWKVDDIKGAHGFLVALGAKSLEAPHNVGGSIEVAVLADPFGNHIGLIQE